MKISNNSATPIERETAIIKNYPFPTKNLSITHIKVSGRHPAGKSKVHIEHKLTLICYILKGSGKFFVKNEVFEVIAGDAIFIKPNLKYYIQGELEYLVCCEQAYYREQHEQVP